MDALISTFHIDTKLLIAQIINFAIVFAVLYFFAIKPISKLMTDRSKKIEEGLSAAKLNNEKLVATQEDYEKTIRQAKKEAQDLFAKAKKDSDIKRTELMDEAQNEVRTYIANGKKELEAEKAKMIEEARTEVAKLVMLATEKVVGAEISDGIDKKVVDKTLRELS